MAAEDTVKAIVDSILKCLECPICLDLLKDPVATGCNHRFCKNCILTALKNKYTVACPLCKSKVTKRQLQEKVHLSEIIQIATRLAKTIEQDLLNKTISEVCSLSSDISSTPNDKKDSNENIENSISTKRRRYRSDEVPEYKTPKTKENETNNKKVQKKQIYVSPDEEELQLKVKVCTNTNVQNGFPTGRRRRKMDSSHSIDKYLIKSDGKKHKLDNNNEQNSNGYSLVPLTVTLCQSDCISMEENIHAENNDKNANLLHNTPNDNARIYKETAAKDISSTDLSEMHIKRKCTRSGRMIQKEACDTKSNSSARSETMKRTRISNNEVIDSTRSKELPVSEKENAIGEQGNCSDSCNHSYSSGSPAIDITTLKRKISQAPVYNISHYDKEPEIRQLVTLKLDPYEFIPSQNTPKVKKRKLNKKKKTTKRLVLPNFSSDRKSNLSSAGTDVFASSSEDFVSLKRKESDTAKTNGFIERSNNICRKLNNDKDDMLFLTPALNIVELNAIDYSDQKYCLDSNMPSENSNTENNKVKSKKLRQAKDNLKISLATQEQISNWFDEISSAEKHTLIIDDNAKNKKLNNVSKVDEVAHSDDGEFSHESDDEVNKRDEIAIAEDCFDDVLSDSSDDMISNDNDRSEEGRAENQNRVIEIAKHACSVTDVQNHFIDASKQKSVLNVCAMKSITNYNKQDKAKLYAVENNDVVESCEEASICCTRIKNVSASNEKLENSVQDMNECVATSAEADMYNGTRVETLEEDMIPESFSSKNKVDKICLLKLQCEDSVQDKNKKKSVQLLSQNETDLSIEKMHLLQKNVKQRREQSYESSVCSQNRNNIYKKNQNYSNENLDDSIEQMCNINNEDIERNNSTNYSYGKLIKNLPKRNCEDKDQQCIKDALPSKSQNVHVTDMESESSISSKCLFNEPVNSEESLPILAIPDTPQLQTMNVLQLGKNVSLADAKCDIQMANKCEQQTNEKSETFAVSASNKNQLSSSSKGKSSLDNEKVKFKMPKRKTFSLEVESQELKDLVQLNQPNTLDLLNEICTDFENSRNKECSIENSAKQLENEENDTNLSNTKETLNNTEEIYEKSLLEKENEENYTNLSNTKETLNNTEEIYEKSLLEKEKFQIEKIQDEYKLSGKDSYEIPCGQKECNNQKFSFNQTSVERSSEAICICNGTCCCKLQKKSKNRDNLQTNFTSSDFQTHHNDFIQNDTPPTSDTDNTLNSPIQNLGQKSNHNKEITNQFFDAVVIPFSSINDDDKSLQNKIIATTLCPGCNYKVQLKRVCANLIIQFITEKADNINQRETIEQCVTENTDIGSVDKNTNKGTTQKCSNNLESNATVIRLVNDSKESYSNDCMINKDKDHKKYTNNTKIDSVNNHLLNKEDTHENSTSNLKIIDSLNDDSMAIEEVICEKSGNQKYGFMDDCIIIKEDTCEKPGIQNLVGSMDDCVVVEEQACEKTGDQKLGSIGDCILMEEDACEKSGSPKLIGSMNDSEDLHARVTEMIPGTVLTASYEALPESNKAAETKGTDIISTEIEINMEIKDAQADDDLNGHELDSLSCSLAEQHKESEDFDTVNERNSLLKFNTEDGNGQDGERYRSLKNFDEESCNEMSEEIDPFLLRHNIPLNNSIETHNIESVLKQMSVSSSDPDMMFAESLVAPLKTYHKINKENQVKNRSAVIDDDTDRQQNSDYKKSTLMETLASCLSPETSVLQKKPLHPSKTVNNLQSNNTKKKSVDTIKMNSKKFDSPLKTKRKKNFHRIHTMSNSDSDESTDEFIKDSFINSSLVDTSKQERKRRVTRSVQELDFCEGGNNVENCDWTETGKNTGTNCSIYGAKTGEIRSSGRKVPSSQMPHAIDFSEIESNEDFVHAEAQEKIRVEIEQMKAQIRQMEIQLLKTESLNSPFAKRREKDCSFYTGKDDSGEDSDDLFSPIPPTPPTSAHKEEKSKNIHHLR